MSEHTPLSFPVQVPRSCDVDSRTHPPRHIYDGGWPCTAESCARAARGRVGMHAPQSLNGAHCPVHGRVSRLARGALDQASHHHSTLAPIQCWSSRLLAAAFSGPLSFATRTRTRAHAYAHMHMYMHMHMHAHTQANDRDQYLLLVQAGL